MEPYIKKSEIVAEIEKRINANNEMAASFSSGSEHDYLCRVKEKVYKDLLSFLDTLETKDVDLEKELDKYTADNFWALERNNDSPYLLEKDDMLKVAKYFYELGLKAKGD